MRERAVLLEGRMQVESQPGSGTRITAELSIADNPVRSPNKLAIEESQYKG